MCAAGPESREIFEAAIAKRFLQFLHDGRIGLRNAAHGPFPWAASEECALDIGCTVQPCVDLRGQATARVGNKSDAVLHCLAANSECVRNVCERRCQVVSQMRGGFAQTLGTLRRENDERRLIGGGGCVRLRILFHDDVSVRTARAE